MVSQRLGTAQLMFVHAGPVIVLDTMLTVGGEGDIVMPATFVLATEPRNLAARNRCRTLHRWATLGLVTTVEITHISGHPYVTFAAGDHRIHRVTFKLAGCVSRPRLVIAADADA